MNPLLVAIDRPAREAIRLQGRPAYVTFGVALAGATLIGVSSGLAALLGGLQFDHGVDLTRLRAPLEALLLVLPSATVLVGLCRLRISPRVFLSVISMGLLVAGVVVAATLPLVAYLTVASNTTPLADPAVLLPVLGLAATAATTTRIVRSIDPTRTAQLFTIGFNLVLAVAWVARFMRV